MLECELVDRDTYADIGWYRILFSTGVVTVNGIDSNVWHIRVLR
jgi:hypothetical protein